MAVVTEPPRRTQGERLNRRPRQNFETWSWFFMRVSGLVLVFLSLLHFAITHILNDVVETDAHFVAQRWENPLWRMFDWALLVLALAHGLNGLRWIIDDYVRAPLAHGLNGLRWIIDDYVRAPAARATVKAVLYSVTGVLFAYGTFTIVSYSGPA